LFFFFFKSFKEFVVGFFFDGHRTLTTEFLMNKEWSNLRSFRLRLYNLQSDRIETLTELTNIQ
jgi:hypothetical protein